MFVKICGVTNEDDALLAVALGADAIGFVFAPSVRQVAAQRVYDITRRLPPEILTVGVFRDEHPKRVIEIVNASGVRAAQLHGHERPSDVAEVSKHVRTVFKAVAAGSTDAAHAQDFGVRTVLLDAPEPGSGKVFDWTLAGNVSTSVNVILAGGLTADNVVSGIEICHPWGVDVSTGVESSPGRKDPMLMKRFIDAARSVVLPEYEGGDNGPYDWMDQ